MIDLKFLRENPEIVKQNIRNKFQDKKLPLVDEVLELDEKLRADVMKQADAEAAARLAGADAEKQKILAAAKAQAAREKDAMLREANEQIGALVSNAVDKLVSDADDPYADFLHAVKRGA